MSKYDFLSIAAVVINILVFFIFRGPNVNGFILAAAMGIIAIFGIFVALRSKYVALYIIINVMILISLLVLIFALLVSYGRVMNE
ncbi:hypothetical protein J14TS2_46130 [Bacillus sp. J14TS2]|uniref:hypothetical protein n=1 Tax=Bacillus sp. J14TS2 TaxID=2807188 RepID=UPI001B1A165A|nr:hypothetical protein [Bacillus sp. J14TS2]GIN74138.1 hypothetical protein J14TS2_46130 [Bacillus sp. J14TS2]